MERDDAQLVGIKKGGREESLNFGAGDGNDLRLFKPRPRWRSSAMPTGVLPSAFRWQSNPLLRVRFP